MNLAPSLRTRWTLRQCTIWRHTWVSTLYKSAFQLSNTQQSLAVASCCHNNVPHTGADVCSPAVNAAKPQLEGMRCVRVHLKSTCCLCSHPRPGVGVRVPVYMPLSHATVSAVNQNPASVGVHLPASLVLSHAVVSAGCQGAADDGAHSPVTQWFWW